MLPVFRVLFRTLPAALTIYLATAVAGADVQRAEAKTPGKTYCYNEVCRRVMTIPEVQAVVGQESVQLSSYYDNCERDPHNPCARTSSGEEMNGDAPDHAASPIYPNGTVLRLVYPKTNRTAEVRINNAGPYHSNRLLDVSRAAAEQLGFAGVGIAELKVVVLMAPSTKPVRLHQKPPAPIEARLMFPVPVIIPKPARRPAAAPPAALGAAPTAWTTTTTFAPPD